MSIVRNRLKVSAVSALALGLATVASAQSASRDAISDLLLRDGKPAAQTVQTKPQMPPKGQSPVPAPGAVPPAAEAPAAERDPREGDASYEQAKKLMQAIDAVLQDTARNRGEAKKLPSKDEFVISPLWTETKEDREKKIRDLLEAALGIVTDVPVVDVQKKVEERRKAIREIEERIVKLREKQLVAPKDGMLPGVLNDTVDSLGKDIADSQKRIELNREEIKKSKRRWPNPASRWRRSRSICCSTACCRAISCGWWRCSTRPKSSMRSSAA
jgi:hypothetical protein